MEKSPNAPTYVMVETQQLEHLVKNQFVLNQSMLLFEYLCSQSRYPLFLSAESACEVLGIKPETLEKCRRQRIIRPRIYQRQFLYSAFDLISLSYKLNQKRIRRMLQNAIHVKVE